ETASALRSGREVLIARAPLGHLEPDLSREILRLFLEVNLRGTTVLLATHDRDLIERIGRRVLPLEAGQLRADVELPGTEPPRLEVPFEIPIPAEEAAGAKHDEDTAGRGYSQPHA